MSKRLQSFIVLLTIYIFAVACGTIVFIYIPVNELVYRLLIADVTTTVIIWLFSMIFKNSSVYDPYWSVIPPVVLLGLMVYHNNFSLQLILLLAGVLFWSIRLTYNWAKLWTDFSEQDWRYEQIKAKNPKLFPLSSLVGIHLVPTLIVYMQLANVADLTLISHNPGFISYLGLVIILLATTLQFIADKEMQNFKLKNRGTKKVINEGTWKHSRHPNYLGEILVWFGVYFFYLDVYGFTFNIISPILMTSMFLFISIPLMEKKILTSRPEYQLYQKEVPVLIPFTKIKFKSKNK